MLPTQLTREVADIKELVPAKNSGRVHDLVAEREPLVRTWSLLRLPRFVTLKERLYITT